jgi:hypothetical protein
MKKIACKSLLAATILLAGFTFTGCESDFVRGTYVDSDGLISIEFLTGGKANFKMAGLVSVACTYTESRKNVTVTCNGDSQSFAINSDGSLGGPAAGLAGKLTRKNR